MNHYQIRAESPLVMAGAGAEKPTTDTDVVLSERAFLGHINLRGDAGDVAFATAAEQVLGVALPTEPNTTVEADAAVLHWLGPDEWLVLTPPEREQAIYTGLIALQAEHHMATTVISGGQTVVRLAGNRAREVLAKGSTLDFHPRVFKPGICAQSTLGKAPITIRQVDEVPTYDIVVRRSFADYLWLWLLSAAA